MRSAKRGLLVIGIAITIFGLVVACAAPAENITRAPLAIGLNSATTDPHPRIVLRGTNLTTAAANAVASGTRTKAVYDAMKGASAPSNPQGAVDYAFVHRVEHQISGSGASDVYGWNAYNYIYNYVTNSANDPQTKWNGYGNIKFYAGEEIIPVALVSDWVTDTDIGSDTGKRLIREYLCEWVNIIDAHLASLTFEDTMNYYAQNIGAEGLALIAIAGESTGTCSLSLYGGATVETRIQQLVTVTIDQYFKVRMRGGYMNEEGLHYQDVSLPEMTVWLAGAAEAGYVDPGTTYAANAAEGQVSRIVPPGIWFQWGDVIESNLTYKNLWPQYIYLFKIAGQRPGDYYVWNTMRDTNMTEAWRTSAGKPFFVTYYDNAVVAAQPTANAMFIPDDLPTTPEPVGGFVMLRDNWSNDAFAARVINRNNLGNHTHFDGGSVEILYRGKQFVLDHAGSYNEEQHGEVIQHSMLAWYDTTAAQWGNLNSNDQTGNTADDGSRFGAVLAFADSNDVGSVAYNDTRYAYVNHLQSGGVYLAKATMTPAPVGRKHLLFSRQAQEPVLAIYDRASLGVTKDWRSYWHIGSDITITGSGTVASPLKLTNTSGDTIYGFATDGRSITAGPNRVYDTSSCSYCESPDTWNYLYYTEQTSTLEPIFSTLWFPSPDGAPTVTLEVLSTRNTYKIERPNVTGYTRYVQNQGGTSITIGRVTTNAEAFMLNYDAAGNIVGGVFAKYTSLQDSGVNLDALSGDRVAVVEFAAGSSSREGVAANSPRAVSTVGAPLSEPTPTATPTATPGPTATPTATFTPTPTATPISGGIRINEVSPNANRDWNQSGNISPADRWFEIRNGNGATANLAGYRIVNELGQTYTFPAIGSIVSGQGFRVVFAEDSLPISSSGTLYLKLPLPSTETIMSLSWGAQTSGLCYAAIPDGGTSYTSNRTCTAGTPNQ